MVLSGLLGSSSSRAAKVNNLNSPSSSSIGSMSASVLDSVYITDEEDLTTLQLEPPDLRELNACLRALAPLFPDVQIEVFRELLSKFDGESRLFVVADTLLKNRVEWVKGRWRALDQEAHPQEPDSSHVPHNEMFRSEEYKAAVKALARKEFRGLPRSTINAVLAESNYAYLDARKTLVDLSTKSWLFALRTLFSRQKPQPAGDPESHPLVIWRSTGRGSVEPCIKPTGCPELDRELFQQLIAPLKKRRSEDQEKEDRRLAVEINIAEAEKAQSLFECTCCFGDSVFEEFTACNLNGHMICFRCIQHSLTEAVFGQGWQRNIDHQTGTLRCPAVDSDGCGGCIPQDQTHRAMLADNGGAGTLHKLEQRLAEHSLVSSGLPLLRCPFCSYAVVDDVYMPQTQTESKVRLWAPHFHNILLVVLCVCAIPPLLLALMLFLLIAAISWLFSRYFLDDLLTVEFRRAQARWQRRQCGLRFQCQNPECRRASCLSCQKAWVDVHVCNESALVALRTQVEQAMSMAIKRVCPKCNTSFVKTAGCNKLTCPCGYKMCYVCRKDIGDTGDGPDVGYRHFCEHFRPEGNPKRCTQCQKCNLWELEDTEKVLQEAKEEAERQWREKENRELSGPEKVFLETGMGVKPSPALRRRRPPTVAEVCDFIVDVFESGM